MPKITVTLQHVKCHKTEDDTGADEVYVVAGHASSLTNLGQGDKIKVAREPAVQPIPAPNGTITGFKKPTHSMNNGDDWPARKVVLEAEVGYGPLEVGMWLFDQDAAETVDEDDVEAVASAINAAGEGLAVVTEGKAKAAALVAEFLVRLIGGLIELDEDDLLGTDTFSIDLRPTATMPPQMQAWYKASTYRAHGQRFVADYDGANYEVYYEVLITE